MKIEIRDGATLLLRRSGTALPLVLGANFGNELTAALGALTPPTTPAALGLSWDMVDGVVNYGDADAAQIAAVNAAKAAHNPALSDPIAAATALLADGIVLTSSSDAALDGTYPCDRATQGEVQAEIMSIQFTGGVSTGTFTNGETSLTWYDTAGAPHTFNPTQFAAFAQAVAKYVTTVKTAVVTSMPSGKSFAAPSSAYTIA